MSAEDGKNIKENANKAPTPSSAPAYATTKATAVSEKKEADEDPLSAKIEVALAINYFMAIRGLSALVYAK